VVPVADRPQKDIPRRQRDKTEVSEELARHLLHDVPDDELVAYVAEQRRRGNTDAKIVSLAPLLGRAAALADWHGNSPACRLYRLLETRKRDFATQAAREIEAALERAMAPAAEPLPESLPEPLPEPVVEPAAVAVVGGRPANPKPAAALVATAKAARLRAVEAELCRRHKQGKLAGLSYSDIGEDMAEFVKQPDCKTPKSKHMTTLIRTFLEHELKLPKGRGGKPS
jgi:hypothetical protein